MRHHLKLLFAASSIFLHTTLWSQETMIASGRADVEPPPKREFRAVWVATVTNIDYPKRPTPDRVAHKEQWKNLLDEYKKMGINAVIFQVRPAGDAFYPTELAPWSKYLTGQQGLAPQPEYDPLEFLIEETHNRSMEFHAWVNPYRATMDLDTFALSTSKHQFYRHRNWLVQYGRRLYFNPGLPEVRQHVVDVVAEIVEKYDVDGIHFDDYFYPYKERGVEFPDTTEFILYGERFDSIADWRRSNNDALVENVYLKIKELKPHVKFGISPFGVWRNRDKDPMGSNTRASIACYDDLYADILKWVRNGWVDYVLPQIYWNIGFAPAEYSELLGWWSTYVRDQHLYIGHAAYKVGENKELAWQQPGEIPRQIEMNRRNPIVKGSAFFSAKSLLANPLRLRDSLQQYYYAAPAFPPVMEHLQLRKPQAPNFLRPRIRKEDIRLRWKPSKADKINPPAYYAIYRVEGSGRTIDYNDPRNILTLTPMHKKGRRFQHIDTAVQPGKSYTYAVSALNRLHNESSLSTSRRVVMKKR